MTSLLHRVIVAHRCRSTHHHIAINALNLISYDRADQWRDLFLVKHEKLLEGAKAPDAVFKDFKNHVLHVGDGDWAGAPDAALHWYAVFVEALRNNKWTDAAYAFGVMSHYYADPIQPFHTGQTEEEGAMHRALEWSIAKSHLKIEARIAKGGYPKVETGDNPTFVCDMVRRGARKSHAYYQTLLDHYNLDAGVKNPEDGLDDTLINILSGLIAYATSGLAAILDRALAEAAVKPPQTSIDLHGHLASLDIPIRWITKKLGDANDRRTVEAMYKEFKKTGKVIKTLPDDDKAIRAMHARQILRIPLKELDARPIGPIGTKHKPSSEPKTTDAPRPVAKQTPAPDSRPKAKNAASKPARPTNTQKPPESAGKPRNVAADSVKKPDAAKQKAAAPPSAVTAKSSPAPETRAEPGPAPKPVEKPAIKPDAAKPITATAQTDAPASKPEPAVKPSPAPQPEPVKAEEPATPKRSLAARLNGAEAEDERPARARFDLDSPVKAAPSIGPITAKRLAEAGVETIEDLLDSNPVKLSAKIDANYITPDAIADWQDQTRLMMALPGLRALDVQILVSSGIHSVDDLASASVGSVMTATKEFLSAPSTTDRMKSTKPPVEDAVSEWIERARNTG